jgi:predicted permease
MPLASLLPLLSYFLVGVLLRRSGILRGEHADILFRLVFFVTLPALAFLAVANAQLTRESVLLPMVSFGVNLACFAAAFASGRILAWPARTTRSVVLSVSIMNMVFTFPFILAVLGTEALAEAVLFDLGNAIFTATILSSMAASYGEGSRQTRRAAVLRMLRTPLFVAMIAAIAFSHYALPVPPMLGAVLAPLGAVTVPLIVMALGLSFSLGGLGGWLPAFTVALRMAGGLLAGLAAIQLLGIEGRTALVIAVSAAAPIGFTAVTLTSIGRLETEQTAAAVSLSVVVGIVTTSVLLWIGRAMI